MLPWEGYLPDLDVYLSLHEKGVSSLQRGIEVPRGQALESGCHGVPVGKILNISETRFPACNIRIIELMKLVVVRIKRDKVC